jgi:hypothetical protein
MTNASGRCTAEGRPLTQEGEPTWTAGNYKIADLTKVENDIRQAPT